MSEGRGECPTFNLVSSMTTKPRDTPFRTSETESGVDVDKRMPCSNASVGGMLSCSSHFLI